MPQQIQVEGVGTVEFPDEFSQADISRELNKHFPQKMGALRAALGHAAWELGPTAAFMAAAGPGAAYGMGVGAMIPFLGETGIPEIVGGAIGGMITGVPAYKLALEAQKAGLKAVVPKAAKQIEEELKRGEREQPWPSMLGGVAAGLPSAEASIPKMAQLPFRLGLGAGMAVGVPLVTEQRWPTGPEIVGGTLMGTIYGKSRFSRSGTHRPPATAEGRLARESNVLTRAQNAGVRTEITDEPLAKPHDVANWLPDKKLLRVNRANLHDYLDHDRPDAISEEKAIDDLIGHETIHTVTPPDMARQFWQNLTPYEQFLEKRRLHGPAYTRGKDFVPLTDEEYGSESIRFWTQLAQSRSATEFVSASRQENQTSRFLTQVQKFVQWNRSKLGVEQSKANLARNRAILDDINNKLEQAKKGAADASQVQATTTVHGDLRAQPVQGVREMPVAEGRPGVQPQAEGRVEEPAQVLLKKARAQSKVISGLRKGEAILESAVARPVGMGRYEYVYGSNHPDILMKMGGQELVDRYATRESRNTPDFGYRTNLREFVPRTELRVRKTGKYPHSDDIASFFEPGEKVGDQVDLQTPAAEQRPRTQIVSRTPVGRGKETLIIRTPTGQQTLTATKAQVDLFIKQIQEREQAPPAAPTVGAQVGQAPPVRAVPPAAPAAGAPAATPTISTTAPVGNLAELQRLQAEMLKPGAPFDMEQYMRLKALSAQQLAAEQAAGIAPKAQGSQPLAMSRKIAPEDTPQGIIDRLFLATEGKVDEPTRTELIKRTANEIINFTDKPEVRREMVEEFQARWEQVKSLDAERQAAAEREATIEKLRAQGVDPGLIEAVQKAAVTGEILDPARIAALVGRTDRPRFIARLIRELNKDPEPVAVTERPRKPDWRAPLVRPGEPVSKAVKPRYVYPGQYHRFLAKIRPCADASGYWPWPDAARSVSGASLSCPA